MKRFMTKKVVTKMKEMKSREIHFLAATVGAMSSSSYELVAANMISGHVSSVETSKNVVMDCNMLL